eukprot:CAMPEP_0115044942 /NCGR_PEP_ID=MMETSP0216-20121206/47841_1 /TAXON_ID=223996 /ORGANISM="Protocruzia adherens, Strain Boccale" /LENGTH=170 /DNA_ID=CAMNT_0002427703 /DNA_START=160 /DNA_END=672 /DNA_ORIENTATION=-
MENHVFGNAEFGDVVMQCSLKLLQGIFDQVIKDFPDFGCYRIGFYSNYKTKKLEVMVQCIKDSYDDYRERPINEHDIDYRYEDLLRDSVLYKYDCLIIPYLNGIEHCIEPTFYNQGDTFELKWHLQPVDYVMPYEYILFMQNASRQDQFMLEDNYRGFWRDLHYLYDDIV